MSRHNARIIAVINLYSMDIKKLTNEEIWENFDNIIQMEEDEEYPVKIDTEYAKGLIAGTIENLTTIDEIISKALVNYTIDRLSYVDRAIIRLAVYEMKFCGVPREVAINEAINLTKDYASIDDKQAKFNNRVLDNIANIIYER